MELQTTWPGHTVDEKRLILQSSHGATSKTPSNSHVRSFGVLKRVKAAVSSRLWRLVLLKDQVIMGNQGSLAGRGSLGRLFLARRSFEATKASFLGIILGFFKAG